MDGETGVGFRAVPTPLFLRQRRRSTWLAAYCGLPPTFEAFLHAVTALRTKLNVPHTLRDFKVDDRQRDLIGDMAIVDPTAGGNPIELTKARALEIFDRALEGRG